MRGFELVIPHLRVRHFHTEPHDICVIYNYICAIFFRHQ